MSSEFGCTGVLKFALDFGFAQHPVAILANQDFHKFLNEAWKTRMMDELKEELAKDFDIGKAVAL